MLVELNDMSEENFGNYKAFDQFSNNQMDRMLTTWFPASLEARVSHTIILVNEAKFPGENILS